MNDALEKASSYGVFASDHPSRQQEPVHLNSGSFAQVASAGLNSETRTEEVAPEEAANMKATISKEKKPGPKYNDAKLIFTDIQHIPWRRQTSQIPLRADPNQEQNDKIEKVAEALSKRGLWQQVDGIHLRRGRFIHLKMKNSEIAEELVQTPLEVSGASLSFRHVTHSGTLVSIMGLPLGYPLVWVKDELSWFGKITRAYRLKRNIFGRSVETATVMVLFEKMDEPIPRDLFFNSQTIHAKYSGQDEALERWEEEQELIRLDQAELAKNKELLQKEIDALENEEVPTTSSMTLDEASVNQMLHYDPEKRAKEGIDFAESAVEDLLDTGKANQPKVRKRTTQEATMSDPEMVPGKSSKGTSQCDPKVEEKKRSLMYIEGLKDKPEAHLFAAETIKTFPTLCGFKAVAQTIYNIARKDDERLDFHDVMASILSLANEGEMASTSFEMCSKLGKGVVRRCKAYREDTAHASKLLGKVLGAIMASK